MLGWDDLDKSKFYIFGPLIFSAVRLATHPAMVVKTRLQTQQATSRYLSTGHAIRSIIRDEGARGLYSGFGVNSLSLLSGQVYITVFEKLKSYAAHVAPDRPEAMRTFMAATTSSMIAQGIGNPIDVVAQTRMVQGSAATGTLFQLASKIYGESGFRGFYRGYSASLMQNAPSSAVWWTSYGWFRSMGMRTVAARYDAAGQCQPTWTNRFVETLSGAAAGSCVAILGSPLDVIRTRVQVGGGTLSGVVRELVKNEGVRGFWKGLSARWLMLAPNGAIMMTAYELIKRLSVKTGQDDSPSSSADGPTREDTERAMAEVHDLR